MNLWCIRRCARLIVVESRRAFTRRRFGDLYCFCLVWCVFVFGVCLIVLCVVLLVL